MIFQSFQSGNLKQLDLEFYLRLRLPTTKRMFRFLDKRFYRRARLDFDLRTLACEHIGMSRSYAPTELKRRLKPALEELEQLGFLEPLSPEERYSYVKRGLWRIILIRGRDAQAEDAPPPTPEASELIEALKARGVTAKAAAELVETLPAGPDPDQDRGLRLAPEERGQAGRQEPGRLPRGVDPGRLPGPRRLPRRPTPAAPAARRGRRGRGRADPRQRPAAARTTPRPPATRPARPSSAPPGSDLPEAERDAILAAVKAENPGLSRWKKMLEPLCLAALEARLGGPAEDPLPGRRGLNGASASRAGDLRVSRLVVKTVTRRYAQRRPGFESTSRPPEILTRSGRSPGARADRVVG